MDYPWLIGAAILSIAGPLVLTTALLLYVRRSRSAEPIWFAAPAYVFGGFFVWYRFMANADDLKRCGMGAHDGLILLHMLLLLAGFGLALGVGIKARDRFRTRRGFPVLPLVRKRDARD